MVAYATASNGIVEATRQPTWAQCGEHQSIGISTKTSHVSKKLSLESITI
jgi:hypothetical protein